MLKIENTDVYGLEAAIRGMRNPMNSWGESDSFHCTNILSCNTCIYDDGGYCRGNHISSFQIGLNDLDLMKKLVSAGTDHSKFMRMITVTCDITAPLYWWKEFDTYKVGTVRNSCSTMHKIHEKEFTLDDFSHEYLMSIYNSVSTDAYFAPNNTCWHADDLFVLTINVLNYYLNRYRQTKDKLYWWQMIQLLPSSYNQRATVQLNYQVLRNMYQARKNHKLDEWHTFCNWIEGLPYSDLITGNKE